MNKTTLVILCVLFTAGSYALAASDSPVPGWQLELGGGFSLLGDSDLNRFTEAENSYLNLYFKTNPDDTTRQDLTFSSHRRLWTGLIRLRHRLGPRVSLTLSVRALGSRKNQTGEAVFEVPEGWRTLTDSLRYSPLGSSLRLWLPSLGVALAFPLSPRLTLLAGLHGGPVFARAELTRNIEDLIEARVHTPPSTYTLYRGTRNQSLNGSATGLGGGITLTLQTRPGSRLGFFLETGLSGVWVSGFHGSGRSDAGGQTRNWTGDWFMVKETVTKPWGRTDLSYPSNDPALLSRRTADFRLSAWSWLNLQAGLSIRL